MKPTLLDGGADDLPDAEPDEDPSGKQEKEDAKVNRKVRSGAPDPTSAVRAY